MEKIIFLGSGRADVIETFNSCFLLVDTNNNYLLVDTGGGNGIFKQFKRIEVGIDKIHNIFLTHKHIDHLYGMLWIYRYVDISMSKGEYLGNLDIYCHEEVAKILREQITTLLRKSQQQFLDKRIFIHVIENHEKRKILNYELEFLDIYSKIDKQFGFKTILNNGKSFVFMGDEPLDSRLFDMVKDVDYLLHEAFCLEKEAGKFNPREKNHDTVESISIKAQNLKVKNLILYHTEESHGEMRKRLYTEEAQSVFSGNVIVPDDLEEIIF